MPSYDGAPMRQPQPVRKPVRRNRQTRMLLFSMIILALFGGAVGLYTLIFANREKTVSMTDTSIATSSTYLNTGDGLLYQTDGQIHFYHLRDSKQNYTYGTAASDIRMSGSEEMACVYNTMALLVIGKDNKPLEFAGTLLSVECGKAYLAALVRATNGSESVLVLTPDGQQVAALTFADQFIVDLGFFTYDTEQLWVQSLGINTGTPTTTITTYDIAKSVNAGVMQIQSQLVDDVHITQNSMFVIGTNQIVRYAHDGSKEIYRTTVYGYRVLDFSSASGTPMFLMTPRGGDMHSVKLLTLEEGAAANAVETYLQLPTEGVAAFLMNGRLVVVSRDQVFTYSMRGKLSQTATLERPVDSAVKLTETVLLLSSEGMYYTVTIK